ncbi:MAG: hypothetical protein HEQ39_13370 [Rhizobacter sp.]
MSFAIKANLNLNFGTPVAATDPKKPTTDAATSGKTEKPSTTTPVQQEQQPTPAPKLDLAAAEKKASDTIQALATQYGVKAGDLATEEGRAKTVTDMWVKINANLEKAVLSKDPEALQRATTEKSAFLEQLKGASGPGWNFGLKELIQPAAKKVTPDSTAPKSTTPPTVPTNTDTPVNEKPAGDVKTEKPTVQPSTPVTPTAVDPRVTEELKTWVKELNSVSRDGNNYQAAAMRQIKAANGALDPSVRANLLAQGTELLARYDSVIPQGEAYLKDVLKNDPDAKRGMAAVKDDYQKIMEFVNGLRAAQNNPTPALQTMPQQ